jgi:hypothetical protein
VLHFVQGINRIKRMRNTCCAPMVDAVTAAANGRVYVPQILHLLRCRWSSMHVGALHSLSRMALAACNNPDSTAKQS